MKKVIAIEDKEYVVDFSEFDDDIDIDDILTIDYSNLIGEIMTFPLIVNRFGILLADMEREVAQAKLNMEVYEAKAKERLRSELQEANGGKNPTVEALNNAVLLDKTFQKRREAYFDVVKERDYVNSIFWSAKDKSEKLNKLSLTVQPGDIPNSVIEGRVNGVMLRARGRR